MDMRYPAAADLDGLMVRGARVVRTAAGPIEYAETGQGPVLLSVHGSGGGWDYALGMAGVFALNGFRVIAPSRPGYLGTPLMVGRTYEQQADALAALLDNLKVDKAAVLGFSAGGVPSYLLATRHPGRVSALIQVGALSTELGRAWNPLMERLFFNRVGMEAFTGLLRTALALRPALGVRLLMSGETTQTGVEVDALAARIMADPVRAAFVTRVWMCSARHVGRWLAGQANDNSQMKAMAPLDLSGVTCPTLIVGSSTDPFHKHDQYAAEHILGADVLTIEGGGHRGFWIADDYADRQAHALAWLRMHTQATRPSSARRRTPARAD